MQEDFNTGSYRMPPAKSIRKVDVGNVFEKILLMDEIASKYVGDVAMTQGGLQSLERLVARLRKLYKTEKGEVFQRPQVTLEFWGDCDDQAIVLAAWCYKHRIPFNYVLMGQGRVTHVTIRMYHPDFEKEMDEVGNIRPKGIIVDCLPYKLPRDAKIYIEVSGYIKDWYKPKESLLGPVMERYAERLAEKKKEMMDPDGEFFARIAETVEPTEDDDESSFLEKVKQQVNERVRLMDVAELDIIDPADVSAYRQEMEGERKVAEAETREEEKEIARAALRKRGRS